MSYHLDPDGNESSLLATSTLALLIPSGCRVLLFGSFDSAWEQALVIYLNDERFNEQLGSYLRPTQVVIPAQPTSYELKLIGWHKRSSPLETLPWIASSGTRIGPVVFAWDDSAADEDYRDLRVKLLTD